MKPNRVNIHDIVLAQTVTGSRGHFRVLRKHPEGVTARRCYGNGREARLEVTLFYDEIEKILRRRDARGWDIPVV
jgi:hypothetical protein